MLNPKINQQIIELWKKHFGDSDKEYAPLLYSDFRRNSILFVGLNPSFSISGFRTFLRDTEHQKIDPVSFFVWKNILSKPKHIDTCIAIDRSAFERYNVYFKALRIIAEKVNLPWEHVDLFLYRQTSQTQFIPYVMRGKKLNEFGLEQMKIFKDALIGAQPKVIVIINALGSEIVRDYFKGDLSFDETHGYDRLILSNTSKVPIFFSSMLTGQRALDRESRERLVWHIRQAVMKE